MLRAMSLTCRVVPVLLPLAGPAGGIVKLRLMAVSDAQYGGFTTGSSPVSWGLID